MLLGPNTVAGALGVPVMTIGVKRYTHEGNRGFAFSLFYSLMNVAALTQVGGQGQMVGWFVCGWLAGRPVLSAGAPPGSPAHPARGLPHPCLQGVIMDTFRIGLKHGFNIPSLPDHSLLNSGSRLFLASGGWVVGGDECNVSGGVAALRGVMADMCAAPGTRVSAPSLPLFASLPGQVNRAGSALCASFNVLPPPPVLPPAGCLTSLIGLIISFMLTEHSSQSTQPKRTGSEAHDTSVRGWMLQLAVCCW